MASDCRSVRIKAGRKRVAASSVLLEAASSPHVHCTRAAGAEADQCWLLTVDCLSAGVECHGHGQPKTEQHGHSHSGNDHGSAAPHLRLLHVELVAAAAAG